MTDQEKTEMDETPEEGVGPAIAGEEYIEAAPEDVPIIAITNTDGDSRSGIQKVEAYMANLIHADLPAFKPGDTVKVHYKIIEGNKERIQVYEGVVIAIKHAGLDKTFIVRKVSWGVGVERTFLYNSRKIDKVQVVRRGRVRRAKIYYLRKRTGKAARIKELRKPKAGAKTS